MNDRAKSHRAHFSCLYKDFFQTRFQVERSDSVSNSISPTRTNPRNDHLHRLSIDPIQNPEIFMPEAVFTCSRKLFRAFWDGIRSQSTDTRDQSPACLGRDSTQCLDGSRFHMEAKFFHDAEGCGQRPRT